LHSIIVEQLYRNLYNWNEWLLLRFFRVITGVKLAFNPDLKEAYIVPIGEVKEDKLEIAQNQMESEFGIQGEIVTENIDVKKTVRGIFLNTAAMTIKLNKNITRPKETAIIGITNYLLVPTNFFVSQIIHFFNPILGITYLVPGICFLTTLDSLTKLDEQIRKDLVEFAVKHEVGHLLGMHGYPLKWLQKTKDPI